MLKNQRGTALPTAMIASVIIAVVAVGIVRFASRASLGASAAANEQMLAACVEAARQQLLSQFHLIGFSPERLVPLNVSIGGTNSTTQALGGHYDSPVVVTLNPDQVTQLPQTTVGRGARGPGDGTGQSSRARQGGAPYKVIVHCQNGTGGGQLEVEFGIWFGI